MCNIYNSCKIIRSVFQSTKRPFSHLNWMRNRNIATAISISLIKIYFKVFSQLHRTFSDCFFPHRHIQSIGENKSFRIQTHTYIHIKITNLKGDLEFWTCLKAFQDNTCLFQKYLFASFFILLRTFLWLTTDRKTIFWNKMNTIYFHPILFCINLLFLVWNYILLRLFVSKSFCLPSNVGELLMMQNQPQTKQR